MYKSVISFYFLLSHLRASHRHEAPSSLNTPVDLCPSNSPGLNTSTDTTLPCNLYTSFEFFQLFQKYLISLSGPEPHPGMCIACTAQVSSVPPYLLWMFLDLCPLSPQAQAGSGHAFLGGTHRNDLCCSQCVPSGGARCGSIVFTLIAWSCWCLPGFPTIKSLFSHFSWLVFCGWYHVNTVFLIKLLPIPSTPLRTPTQINHHCDGCQMVIFYLSFYIYHLASYCKEELSINSLTLPFIYICMDSWICIYSIYFYHFLCSDYPRFTQWKPLEGGSCVSLTCSLFKKINRMFCKAVLGLQKNSVESTEHSHVLPHS